MMDPNSHLPDQTPPSLHRAKQDYLSHQFPGELKLDELKREINTNAGEQQKALGYGARGTWWTLGALAASVAVMWATASVWFGQNDESEPGRSASNVEKKFASDQPNVLPDVSLSKESKVRGPHRSSFFVGTSQARFFGNQFARKETPNTASSDRQGAERQRRQVRRVRYWNSGSERVSSVRSLYFSRPKLFQKTVRTKQKNKSMNRRYRFGPIKTQFDFHPNRYENRRS